MTISKILSRYRHRFLYLAMSLVLLLLVMESMWYIIVVPWYLYFLLKQLPDMIKPTILICFLYGVSIITNMVVNTPPTVEHNVTILSIQDKETYSKAIAKSNNQKVYLYFSDQNNLVPGDVIEVSGEITQITKNTIPGTFDYFSYSQSKGITFQCNVYHYTYVEHRFVLGTFPYHINHYIEEELPLSKQYIKTFILADKSDFSNEEITEINKLGISHLFAVSGLHVALLILAISSVLRFVQVPEKMTIFIMIMLLILYMIITNFTPSITRASLGYVFLVINKKYNLNLSSYDIVAILFIILIIQNPYAHYHVGFTLSFLMTIGILLGSNITKHDTKLISLFLVGFICFLLGIPITTSMQHEINIITLFCNVFFVIIMTYTILPLCYITFLLPFLDHLSSLAINLFEQAIHLVSTIDLLRYRISFHHPIQIIIYYTILLLFLGNYGDIQKRKQYGLLLIVFLIILPFSPSLSPLKEVTFLDVKGDATFIKDHFDQCNVVIDTGEQDTYDSVISYLKHKNIKRIDLLILTHHHNDHIGEAEDILREFEVVQILSNKVTVPYLECGSLYLHFYNKTTTYNNENNNSLVFSLFIANKEYLFTGDIEQEREEELLQLYTFSPDYLKVAHHGSSTSTTDSFMEHVSPKEAFVMVHRTNRHNHPSDIVMNRMREHNTIINRTDNDGSISMLYFHHIEWKKTYPPA